MFAGTQAGTHHSGNWCYTALHLVCAIFCLTYGGFPVYTTTFLRKTSQRSLQFVLPRVLQPGAIP